MDKIINSACSDELDNWFNELDEKTIEIINNDLIKDEFECNIEETRILMDDDDDMIHQTTKYICIDDILKKDPSTLTSNEIIMHECSISYFVQVLVEGSGNNKNKTSKLYDNELSLDKLQSIIEYFSWISLSSEILAKRIGQELLIYGNDENNKPSIVRSSYNFCTKYTQCKNFYSKEDIPSCREHHYVHSLLKYDIDSVISFLNYVTKNNSEMTKEEIDNIYLSIKTICFVTRHMAKEISYIDFLTKNNSEYFHRNNPIEINRMRNNNNKKSWHINTTNEKLHGNDKAAFYQNKYTDVQRNQQFPRNNEKSRPYYQGNTQYNRDQSQRNNNDRRSVSRGFRKNPNGDTSDMKNQGRNKCTTPSNRVYSNPFELLSKMNA